MTARPVAPVIPGASPGRRQGNSGARRPVPLASPPGRPDVVYGFGRIDASGRVADRVIIAALGGPGGDRLTVIADADADADAGIMIARRDPGGMVTVPARPYIVIPAALRRRAGPAAAGPGPGRVPGPAAGEGRDGPLAAGLPHLDGPPDRARPAAACPAGRAAAAVRQRAADHPLPL